MTKALPAADGSQSEGPNRSDLHLETSKGVEIHLNQENQSRNDKEQGMAKSGVEAANEKETLNYRIAWRKS